MHIAEARHEVTHQTLATSTFEEKEPVNQCSESSISLYASGLPYISYRVGIGVGESSQCHGQCDLISYPRHTRHTRTGLSVQDVT